MARFALGASLSPLLAALPVLGLALLTRNPRALEPSHLIAERTARSRWFIRSSFLVSPQRKLIWRIER